MITLKRFFFCVVLLAGVLAGVLLHQANFQSTIVDLYFYKFEIPLSMLILLSLSLGFLAGWLAQLPRQWRASWRNRRLRHRLERATSALEQYEAIKQDGAIQNDTGT